MNFEQLNQSSIHANEVEEWKRLCARKTDAMNQFSQSLMAARSGPAANSDEDQWPPHAKPVSRPVTREDAKKPGEVARRIDLHGPAMTPRLDRPEWLRIVDIVTNHVWAVILFTITVFATAVTYSLMMKPIYEPEARVEVDPPGAEVFSLQGNQNGGAATDYMETQAQNLKSDELSVEVIRKLHLDQSPYFGADPKAVSGISTKLAGVAVALTPAENRALAIFKSSRKVTRDAASRLITVSVAAPDPQVAALATNTLVSTFIDRDYTLRNEAISQSSRWLQRQLEDIRQRMEDSNRALNSYQAEHGMSGMGDNQDKFSDEMVELDRQLLQARADRIQLQSYLGKMKGTKVSTLPQIDSNPVVQELTKKLAEVKADLAETRTIYGTNHPNTRKLQSQADELSVQLDAERAEILGSLNTSYTAAQTREQLTQSQVEGASKHMAVLAEYDALKKEAAVNTQLYQELYQKIKEADIAAESKSSNIRIVDRARVLDHPTRPNRIRTMGTGLFIGLLGGVMLAFLFEALDTRIRTPEDIKRCLGTDSVSLVPAINSGGQNSMFAAGPRLPSRSRDDETPLFQITRPESPEGEALRSLGVLVRLSSKDASTPQVLLVVSPSSGEGKTTLSLNLAVTLAQHGITCIVDADLRKGRVSRALHVNASHGIKELLANTMVIDDVLVPVPHVARLSVLAPGSVQGEPGELLSSAGMAEVLQQLRARFDFIVVDSPPMLLFSDACALSTFVDGVIVVGRSGVTTRAHLTRTLELLGLVRSAPVVQIVLNGAQSSSADYGYYGQNKAYERYTQSPQVDNTL